MIFNKSIITGFGELYINKVCFFGITISISFYMSKLISVKIDEKVLEETDEMVKKLNISRNKFVNEAIVEYTKMQKRAELEEQIRKEIGLIRESSLEVLKEFEALEDDYETI
jgi:metal-responsive CopG/Arc/MetJ family transcriptional regulator